MSYHLMAVRSRPMGLWLMDDTTPLQDYSGLNASGTTTGTITRHLPLCAGAEYASVVTPATPASFTFPLFKAGTKQREFTLAAWARPIATAGVYSNQMILGHLDAVDGLFVNGSRITFTIRLSDDTYATITHENQVPEKVFVVGTYTPQAMALYVDSELVGTHRFTEAQELLDFDSTQNLSAGYSATTGQQLALNGVAVYAKALSYDEIDMQYDEGSRAHTFAEVAAAFGGTPYTPSANASDLFMEKTWALVEDWKSGLLDNISVTDGNLKPVQDNGISLAGSWRGAVPLVSDATSVFGGNILWDGEGAIVEASLDGVTWSAVTRGAPLSIMPAGFNPTDKTLHIRVSFTGGVLNDTSFLDNLTFFGFKTGAPEATGTRTITYTPPVQLRRDTEANWFSDDAGAVIGTGGIISMGAETADDPDNTYTLEIWLKRGYGSSGDSTFSDGTFDVIYANGAAPWVTNEVWQHYILVSNTPDTDGFDVFSASVGPVQLAGFTIYPRVITATEAAQILKAHLGVNTLKISDTSSIGIASPVEKPLLYIRDWSIVSAG